MRKVILILAVVLFTVPAWAAVTVTCTVPAKPSDPNVVTVSYVNGDVPKDVVAFALDITVTNGTITSVSNPSAVYKIYPGSIVIVDGNVTGWGSLVANPNDLPGGTLGGLGTSGITIEMGALTSPPGSEPNSGDLFKFKVTPTVANQDSVITIVKNTGRGGVVMTDPNLNPTLTAPGCTIPRVPVIQDCLIGGNAGTKEFTDWVAWNKPNCWCYCRQCRGDADGVKTGTAWVSSLDLITFGATFNKNDTALKAITNGICNDYDHKKAGTARVNSLDLIIFPKYYNKTQTNVPRCDLADPPRGYAAPYTGPYNFWCNPAGCPFTCP